LECDFLPDIIRKIIGVDNGTVGEAELVRGTLDCFHSLKQIRLRYLIFYARQQAWRREVIDAASSQRRRDDRTEQIVLKRLFALSYLRDRELRWHGLFATTT